MLIVSLSSPISTSTKTTSEKPTSKNASPDTKANSDSTTAETVAFSVSYTEAPPLNIALNKGENVENIDQNTVKKKDGGLPSATQDMAAEGLHSNDNEKNKHEALSVEIGGSGDNNEEKDGSDSNGSKENGKSNGAQER